MYTMFWRRIVGIILSVLLLSGTACAAAQAAPGKGGSTTTQSTIQLASSQATPAGTYLPGCTATSSAPIPAATTTLAVTQFKQSVRLHPDATLALQFDVQYQWSIYLYDPQHLLQAQEPQGTADAALHHCVWQYVLHGTGQATVIAIGQLHCAPGKWCPRYTIAHEVDVSSQ